MRLVRRKERWCIDAEHVVHRHRKLGGVVDRHILENISRLLTEVVRSGDILNVLLSLFQAFEELLGVAGDLAGRPRQDKIL